MNAQIEKVTTQANPKNRLPKLATFGIHSMFTVYSLLCIIPIILVIMVSITDEGAIVRGI